MPPNNAAAARAAAMTAVKAAQTKTTQTKTATNTTNHSPKQFLDATATIRGLLAQCPTQQPTKNSQFLSSLKIALGQLQHHHTRTQFLKLNSETVEVYQNLLTWFTTSFIPKHTTKGISDADLETIAILINVIAYVIPLQISEPVNGEAIDIKALEDKTESDFAQGLEKMGRMGMTKKQKQRQQQSQLSPTQTVQHAIFSAISQLAPVTFLQPILALITALLPAPTTPPSATTPQQQQKRELKAQTQSQMISNLLTIIQQGLKWASFIQGDAKFGPKAGDMIANPSQIYTTLGSVFATYVDNSWSNVKTKVQAEMVAMIVEIIAIMMTYYGQKPSTNDDNNTDGEEEQKQQQQEPNPNTLSQTQHIITTPESINALCSILLSLLSSFIVTQINHQTHPLVPLLATGKDKPNHGPASTTNEAFELIMHQVLNMTHYLTVAYIDWIESLPHGVEQSTLLQSGDHPWAMYINEDLLQLFVLFLKFLDNSRLISIDDEAQSAIRRIVGVLMGSGIRHNILMVYKSGFLEFVLDLVWEQPKPDAKASSIGSPRKSAIMLRPDLVAVKTPEQKQSIEQAYNRQIEIELGRIQFFTLSLDLFVMFGSMGYATRHLIINQFHLLEVLSGVIRTKIIGIDKITTKQQTIVEKIGILLKNLSSSVETYDPFDYQLWFNMNQVGSVSFGSFLELEQQQLKYFGIESKEELEKDEQLAARFRQRVSDDIFSIYIYQHYTALANIFQQFYPLLSLYYEYPPLPDVSTIASGTATTKTTEDNDNTTKKANDLDKDMAKMVAYAKIKGGLDQQNNNFIIAADLVTSSFFAPIYHLYSYNTAHHANKSVTATRLQNENGGCQLSPIQQAAFNTMNQGQEFNMSTFNTKLDHILKSTTKSFLIGLQQDNQSNDNPRVIMKDQYPKEAEAGKEEEQQQTTKPSDQILKIDALVSQIVQFSASSLENKFSENGDSIAEHHKFQSFRTNYESVEVFLKQTFPGVNF